MALELVNEMKIVAFNSGSSSLKFGLYKVSYGHIDTMFSGEIESIGQPASKFRLHDSQGNTLLSETDAIANQSEALIRIEQLFADGSVPTPDAIGHRIVHGGPRLRQHVVIDDVVVQQLAAATAFAPLHTPSSLAVLRFAQKYFPGLPQVACFDTTFHKDMPDVARIFPIARELQLDGVQRYGFHGLSCESILQQLGKNSVERLIIAHLGNGASVTAVKAGKSIDTSMGLSPAGGLMMGTRSGDLDPGVLLYLMQEKKYDAAMLQTLLNRQSGLLGISGISSDMRMLHEAATTDKNAKLAIQMFCYSVRKEIASMISALEGIDMLVFTGGIGENDARVRAKICSGLSWVGVNLDTARNQSALHSIHQLSSSCAINVLPSQEDRQVARHTWELCSHNKS